MKLKKVKAKNELERVVAACIAQGFDFYETPHKARLDTMGNFKNIDVTSHTPDALMLIRILKDEGFVEE